MTDKKAKILIADDDTTNSAILVKTLEGISCDIYSVKNGSECVITAKSIRPQIIILDIMMPDMDGFEVMQRLKMDPSTVNIPVIMISAMDDISSKIKGFELGIVDYITKPFFIREVLARVNLHLKLFTTIESLKEIQAETLKQINMAQRALLAKPEDHPNSNVSIVFETLHAAGGDFYEILDISNDVTAYFIGDFAGHNVSTSYLTSSIKVALKQNCNPVFTPLESMIIINGVLTDIMDPAQYLTACFAVLNRKRGNLTVVTMGHPPAILIPRFGKPVFIEGTGDVLGAFPNVIFESRDIDVESGDKLLLYTDGLIENVSENIWTGRTGKLLDAAELLRDSTTNNLAHDFYNSFRVEKSSDDVVAMGITVRGVEPIYWKSFENIIILDFRSELTYLEQAIAVIVNFTTSRIKIQDLYGFKLVLFEIIGNAILHGNKQNPAKWVEIELTYDTTQVTIIIKDEGEGFDWGSHLKSESIDIKKTHGRGLKLSQSYGYNLTYNKRGNVCFLNKDYNN